MEWLTYLLKVSVCSALFFGFYLLVLRKLTFFKFNRFYLLATLLLSFIIPALQVELIKEVETTYSSYIEVNHSSLTEKKLQALPQLGNLQGQELEAFNWHSLILIGYTAIALSILGFYLFKLMNIFIQAKKYSRSINGLKIISKQTGFTNCSFFNYVFVNDAELKENELTVLLRHEAVHAKQYHSVDKIILMFSKAVLWFNPIVYLYDKVLEQTHEYEADEATSKNIGANCYANLLLKLATAHAAMPMVHNFVKSPIKERIKMLFNQKSKKMKKASYLLAFPIAAVLTWLFAVEVVYAYKENRINSIAKLDGFEKLTNKNNTKSLIKPSLNLRSNQQKALIKKQDSITPNAEKFKLISSESISGKSADKITHFKGAVIEVMGGVLRADEAEWNPLKLILKSKGARFEKKGSVLESAEIVFDIKNSILISDQSSSQTYDPDKIISYQAQDSVRFSKDELIVYLYGQAKINYGEATLTGSQIFYNKKLNTAVAKDASFYRIPNKLEAKADSISINFKDLKIKVLGKNKSRK